MLKSAIFFTALLISVPVLFCQGRPSAPSFEVATIKPVESGPKSPRFIVMQGTNRFVEKDYTLKLLIAAAYNLNPKAVTGGPSWMESDHYDILALTPEQQAAHPRRTDGDASHSPADRFKLAFHRESKVFPIYSLELAKGGSKLKPTASPTDQPHLISTVYPQRIVLPARNASMADFTSVLQRAILDRPVLDKTDLPARYDFDLEWAPDESQFGGDIPASTDASIPPLFTAIQQQLGLRIVATRGPIQAIAVDHADHPSAN